VWDDLGFTKKVYAYDAPHTIGLLAKKTKIHEKGVIPIPKNSYFSLKQWACFSIRYVTAWANWKAAYGCFRAVLPPEECPRPFVWGWGGGTTLAELELSKHYGCSAAMISSTEERLDLIRQKGITPIDRRNFMNLSFDEKRYQIESGYKKEYQDAEEAFLQIVKEHTQGKGISIFIDFLGLPVIRASLKALACPGVLATAGWKAGMRVSHFRAIECMNWHMHVHTHYARYNDGLEAARFAEERGWMPEVNDHVYPWEDIPRLAMDYTQEKTSTYFPLFSVNPV
jgi:NADPH:quinone reductase-like Zn-dependent oxidoreductase